MNSIERREAGLVLVTNIHFCAGTTYFDNGERLDIYDYERTSHVRFRFENELWVCFRLISNTYIDEVVGVEFHPFHMRSRNQHSDGSFLTKIVFKKGHFMTESGCSTHTDLLLTRGKLI